jgi:hypothetical protein
MRTTVTPLAPAALAALSLFLSIGAAQAQSRDAAREALGKREGDVDQTTLLKQTLSAADKQYSLLKRGQRALTYDLTYSYIGQQLIDASFSDDRLTQFQIQNTRGHTITNTLALDYGLKDNLTANLTLPLVSRYSTSDVSSGLSNAFGDIAIGARYQPFALKRDSTTFTGTGTLRLPTGRSPFKTIENTGLATGAGYTQISLGLNASRVIDPVALFGSVNLHYGLPAKHLNQIRGDRTLVKLEPGPGIGFGIGFAYALSYNISTTLSFQETISARSKLTFADGSTARTSTQASAMLNLGLGVRTSPQTTVNYSVGVGLTNDSPDFTFGINLPLHF